MKVKLALRDCLGPLAAIAWLVLNGTNNPADGFGLMLLNALLVLAAVAAISLAVRRGGGSA